MKPILMKQYPGWPLLEAQEILVPTSYDLGPVLTAPGESVALHVRPKAMFRADYIVLTDAQRFSVSDVRVAESSQFDPRPAGVDTESMSQYQFALPSFMSTVNGAVLLAMAAARAPLRIAICPADARLDVLVKNTSGRAAALRGRLVGWQVTKKPAAEEED